MFDFLGTFTVEEWRELVDFYEAEVLSIKARIDHLTAEILRLGPVDATGERQTVSEVSRTKELPVFREGPVRGTVARLLEGARMAGIPVSATATNVAQSIGEAGYYLTPQGRRSVDGLPDEADGAPSIYVGYLKSMALPAIKAKREQQEFRLKKVRDLREQLEDERALLVQQLRDRLDSAREARIGAVPQNRGRNVIATVNAMFQMTTGDEDAPAQVFPSLIHIEGVDLPDIGAEAGLAVKLPPVQKANTVRVQATAVAINGGTP